MKTFSFLFILLIGLSACGSGDKNADKSASEEPAPTAPAPEAGTSKTWVLTAYGNANNPMTPPADAKVTLQMDLQDDRISGNSGCNNFFGSLKNSPEGYKFSQMGGTKKMCVDEAVMALEDAVLDQLSKVTSYEIANNRLIMEVEGGRQLVFASE